MDLDMVRFNELFKKNMNKAKILEKTHPSKSINLWIQICQLMVEFTKSPNCPRDLRPKLLRQADAIVKKVKMLQNPQQSSSFMDTSKQNSENHAKSSISNENEEDMISKLSSLPETPKESVVKDKTVDTKVKKDEDTIKFVPKDIDMQSKSPSSVSKSTDSISDISELAKLEDMLKEMPENLKEIKPAPFSSKSIIPGSISDNSKEFLNSYKKDTQTLDVTKDSIVNDKEPDISKLSKQNSNSNNPDLKIAGVTKNPFKSEKETDPFGPDAHQKTSEDSSKERHCFACGATIKLGEKICPLCGTENPLEN